MNPSYSDIMGCLTACWVAQVAARDWWLDRESNSRALEQVISCSYPVSTNALTEAKVMTIAFLNLQNGLSNPFDKSKELEILWMEAYASLEGM